MKFCVKFSDRTQKMNVCLCDPQKETLQVSFGGQTVLSQESRAATFEMIDEAIENYKEN